MSTFSSQNVRRTLQKYRSVETIPASVSMLFLATSLYQYGGLAGLNLTWFGGWELASQHVMPIAVVTMLLALASSKTKNLANYSPPEQFFIGGMATFTFGWNLTPPDWWMTDVPLIGQAVHDLLMAPGDPLAGMIAMAVTLLGWAALIQ
jgi:hypothetical protein